MKQLTARGSARVVAVAAMAAIALLSAHCSQPPLAASIPGPPETVIFNPEPSTGAFVVVAVDNHFHDIHPIDQTRIAVSRPFIVDNQGRNLHNFTVIGTDISIDIKPGHELVWRRLGAHLTPGFYQVVCTYHNNVGMIGSFYVTK